MLTDRRAAASDTLATSYILSQAIRTIGKYDFVFCGRQAIDGDTAQVGPQCAEKLDIPQITYLEKVVALSDDVARIRRNIGQGYEVVEVKLPVLVTVVDTANCPRPPAARRVMRCKKARVAGEIENEVRTAMADASDEERRAEVERRAKATDVQGLMIEQWDLDRIGADLQRCGLAGSPTKVQKVLSVVLTTDGFQEVAATEEGVRRLVQELVVDRTLG